MKAIRLLIAVILAIASAGCQTSRKHIESKSDFVGMPTTDFTITLVCSSPDVAFTGTIINDGERQEVSGVGRGTYHISSHHLVCSFMRSGASGTFVFTILVGGPEQSSSSVGIEAWSHGVLADFLRTPSMQHTRLETF
ncbi:MAG TPA: hypothetical protein PKJ98_04670 [Verrucomicrobiota bacterium]|nr:hypothetical protein [Verrucomicrobiota bacterium]